MLQNWTDVYGSHKKGNEGRLHQNVSEALNKILGCYSEGHLLLLSAQYCDWPSQDGKKKKMYSYFILNDSAADTRTNPGEDKAICGFCTCEETLMLDLQKGPNAT